MGVVLTTVDALKSVLPPIPYEPHYTLPVTILSQLQSFKNLCICVCTVLTTS